MKQLYSKTPAKIALGITLVSLLLVIAALVIHAAAPSDNHAAHGPGFTCWMFSYFAALLSIPFYLVDMSRAKRKAEQNIDSRFNRFLFWVILISIPVFVAFGGSFAIAWNVYYLFLFIIETVSVVRSSRADTAPQVRNVENQI